MTAITDINTSGASSQVITARGLMGVTLNGTWNSATVSLQKKIGGSWYTIKDYTANANDVIESVGSATYRFSTSGTPSIICEVTFETVNYPGGEVAG